MKKLIIIPIIALLFFGCLNKSIHNNPPAPQSPKLITPDGGEIYNENIEITMNKENPNDEIYYRYDNDRPNVGDHLYEKPFTIDKTTDITAAEYDQNNKFIRDDSKNYKFKVLSGPVIIFNNNIAKIENAGDYKSPTNLKKAQYSQIKNGVKSGIIDLVIHAKNIQSSSKSLLKKSSVGQVSHKEGDTQTFPVITFDRDMTRHDHTPIAFTLSIQTKVGNNIINFWLEYGKTPISESDKVFLKTYIGQAFTIDNKYFGVKTPSHPINVLCYNFFQDSKNVAGIAGYFYPYAGNGDNRKYNVNLDYEIASGKGNSFMPIELTLVHELEHLFLYHDNNDSEKVWATFLDEALSTEAELLYCETYPIAGDLKAFNKERLAALSVDNNDYAKGLISPIYWPDGLSKSDEPSTLNYSVNLLFAEFIREQCQKDEKNDPNCFKELIQILNSNNGRSDNELLSLVDLLRSKNEKINTPAILLKNFKMATVLKNDSGSYMLKRFNSTQKLFNQLNIPDFSTSGPITLQKGTGVEVRDVKNFQPLHTPNSNITVLPL